MKINRRTMLASLVAASGASLSAQEPAKFDPRCTFPGPTAWKISSCFTISWTNMHSLTWSRPHPRSASRIFRSSWYRAAGNYGKILGHVSRQNPQSQVFDGRQTATIVFRGPHGYISPMWYRKEAVPTWNFAVVHATGRASAITDKIALHKLLGRLIEKFESQEASGYDFSKLPETYVSPMLGGIVGFEMQIESLEGKFKLGQERSDADKQGLLQHLGQARRREHSLQELTARFPTSALNREDATWVTGR